MLRPVDALIVAFAILLSAIILFFVARIESWAMLITINLFASLGIMLLSLATETTNHRVVRAVHDWYPVPSIFFLFKEVYVIIQSLGRTDWDNFLIRIDRGIFGTDPTVWLAQFSWPALTEILQLAYTSYYFIMLTAGIELYLQREKQKFSSILFTIVYGFFLSYIGYIAFPAVGPRFTLHNFDSLGTELPGLWLTNGIREFLNAGESIPTSVSNAIAFAQRDAFPSGHTQMTLISLYFAFHYKLKSRYVLFIFGTLLIISTIYLRYHYVVDLIGGLCFMVLTVWTAPKLFELWETRIRTWLK